MTGRMTRVELTDLAREVGPGDLGSFLSATQAMVFLLYILPDFASGKILGSRLCVIHLIPVCGSQFWFHLNFSHVVFNCRSTYKDITFSLRL